MKFYLKFISKNIIVIIGILLFIINLAEAQINKHGTSFIRNYTPKEYNAFAQNWGAMQDIRGLMFFANNFGILEYDGSKWRLNKANDGELLRSLTKDKDGVLYFGTSQRFGYAVPDINGKIKLVFLSDLFDITTKNNYEFWKIVALGGDVYFFSEKYLYRYSKTNKSIKKWDLDNNIFQIHSLRNQLYLSSFTQGLLILQNDSLLPVKNGDFFIDKAIVSILPYGSDSALVFTFYEGIYKTGIKLPENMAFVPFNKTLNQFLTDKSVYTASCLKNGRIAIGTIGSGLLIIDKKGTIEEVIDEKAGLISNNISSVFVEESDLNNDVLWLCTDKGISKIEYQSPIREFIKTGGLKGFVQDFIRYEENLYVATTEGVYYYDIDAASGKAVFTKIEDIKFGAWRFLKLTLKNNKYRLYVCTSGFIYEITGRKALPLKGDYYIKSCLQLEKNNEIIYLGLDKGLLKAKIQNDRLLIEGLIRNSGISDMIRNMIEDKKGNLWLLGEKDGVMHYDTEKDTVIKFFNPHYDSTINYDIHAIFQYDNIIYLGTSAGIYEYNEKEERFVQAYTLSCSNDIKSLHIERIKIYNNTAWALISKNNINSIVKIYFNKCTIEEIPFKRILDENIWCFYEDIDNFLLLGSIDKMYTLDRNNNKNYHNTFYSLVRKVSVNGDSVIFWGTNHTYTEALGERVFSLNQHKEDVKEIKYKYNNLSFEYACPYYEAEDALVYSYFLEGNDNTWSDWTTKTEKEYTNLFEGEYTFNVKARNVYGFESRTATYKFVILPPWYRTIWAYIAYLLLLILFIWGIVKLSIYRLQQINKAYGKYLPGSFLKMLDKRRIIDFKLGDMAEKEMSIMFSDIRSYTSLSESMVPQDNFRFLVRYLKHIGEMLNKNKGFPVQYYGDGVMAMFHGKTDNPVQAAIDMHRKVADYSADRVKKGRREIKIGVGIHTGKVIMGIRGDDWRWEGGIVGDSVNIASRIEGLTKIFGVSTIITEDVFERIEKPGAFKFRYLGKVQVKGKENILKIYELIDGNPADIIETKIKMMDEFNHAMQLFQNKQWPEAMESFNAVIDKYNDLASKYYVNLITNIINGNEENFDGILIIN